MRSRSIDLRCYFFDEIFENDKPLPMLYFPKIHKVLLKKDTKTFQPVRLEIVVGAVSHRTMSNGIQHLLTINSHNVLATVR